MGVQHGVIYVDLGRTLTTYGIFFLPYPFSGAICTLVRNLIITTYAKLENKFQLEKS